MFHYLKPDLYSPSILEIDLCSLHKRSIKGIICDMDNTLVSWEKKGVDKEIVQWCEEVRERGFKMCLVSNGLIERVEKISHTLDVPYVAQAIKPRRRPFKKAAKILDLHPDQLAVIGDQVFTDVLGGNRMGMLTILVDPLSKKEFPGTKVTRLLERVVRKRALKASFSSRIVYRRVPIILPRMPSQSINL